jgi:hypothetical protein
LGVLAAGRQQEEDILRSLTCKEGRLTWQVGRLGRQEDDTSRQAGDRQTSERQTGDKQTGDRQTRE